MKKKVGKKKPVRRATHRAALIGRIDSEIIGVIEPGTLKALKEMNIKLLGQVQVLVHQAYDLGWTEGARDAERHHDSMAMLR